MVKKKRFDKVKKFLFKHTKAKDLQVNYFNNTSFLTRMANSYIHQNVHEHNENIIINAIFGKKTGVASTNDLSEKSLLKTLRHAEKIAKLRPEDPDYPGLPKGMELEFYKRFNENTHKSTPRKKALVLKDVVKLCKKAGVAASGFISSDTTYFGVATTNGADTFASSSGSHLFLITDKGNATGFAEEYNDDITKINHENIAKIASLQTLEDNHDTLEQIQILDQTIFSGDTDPVRVKLLEELEAGKSNGGTGKSSISNKLNKLKRIK